MFTERVNNKKMDYPPQPKPIITIDDAKWDGITIAISTMYGILLVCLYVAFSYTQLVKFPVLNNWLEINGFFIYLYLLGIFYLIYMLIFVLRGTNKPAETTDARIKVVENEEVKVEICFIIIVLLI